MVFTDFAKEALFKLQTVAPNVVNQRNGPPLTASSATPLDAALVSKLKQYADYAQMVNSLRPETSDPILQLLSAFDDYLVTPMQPLSEHLGTNLLYTTCSLFGIQYILFHVRVEHCTLTIISY